MRWLLGGILVALMGTAAVGIIPRLAALELSRRFQSEAALTQAIELDPTQPEFYRERAELRQNALRVQSYQLAGEDLIQATRLNPYYWRYWNDLARHYERVGDLVKAEGAYRRAVDLSPLNGLYHWSLFNFLLRQGEIDGALPELKKAIRLDSDLRAPGLDMLIGLGLPSATILEVWPSDIASWENLILDLAHRPDPTESRDEVLLTIFDLWLESSPSSNLPLDELVNYFIRRGNPDQARSLWIRYFSKTKGDYPDFTAGKTFVWNGDFETPFHSGGMGWFLERNPLISANRVQNEGFQSSASLRIRIDGRIREASGVLLRQLIFPPPGKYRLSCLFRVGKGPARGVLKLVLIQMNTGETTTIALPAERASDWVEISQDVTIPPNSSNQIWITGAHALSGLPLTFWIDEIRLSPMD